MVLKNFKLLAVCLLMFSLAFCAFRKKGEDEATDDGGSRPDTKGVPTDSVVNSQKGQFDLGASFRKAQYSQDSKTKSLTGNPDVSTIKLPRLSEHSCRFMDFSSSKIFRWDFRSKDESFSRQSLDVDLRLTRIPTEGEVYTIKGFFSSLGSVSLSIVQRDSLAFGSWSTSSSANEDRGSCTLEVVYAIDNSGQKIQKEAEVQGPFRVEGLLKCTLANFFDDDSKKKMLNFEAELGCTGNAGSFF